MRKNRRRTHRVKPALIKSPLIYALEDGVLICEDAKGSTLWRMALSDIRSAHWTASRAGQSLTRVLRLRDATQTCAIRQHLYRRALVGGPDDMAFRATVVDILRALMAVQPGLEVDTGPTAATSALLRLCGHVLLAGACAAPVYAVATGQPLMAIANWAVPVALIGLLGLALRRTYAPGRQRPRLVLAQLIAELDQA